MLRHMRLNEHGATVGIESGGQPVEQNVERILFDSRGVGVVRGKSVPVGDKEEAFILTLHTYPVVQSADKIPQMQFARGAHTAEHAFAMIGTSSHHILIKRELNTPRTGKISKPRKFLPKYTTADSANHPIMP